MAMFTRIPEYNINRQYELSYEGGIQLIKQLLNVEDDVIEAFTELSSTVRGYSFEDDAAYEARRIGNKDVVMVQGTDGDEDWFYVVDPGRMSEVVSHEYGLREFARTIGTDEGTAWRVMTGQEQHPVVGDAPDYDGTFYSVDDGYECARVGSTMFYAFMHEHGPIGWVIVYEDARRVSFMTVEDGLMRMGMTMEEFLNSEHECLWELRTIDCPDEYEGRLIDGMAWFLLPGIGFIINR